MTERFTVRQLAKLWGKSQEHVFQLIRTGQLRAVDVSLKPGKGRRPSYIIKGEEIERFENQRATRPPPHRAICKRTTKVKDYFAD